MTTTIEQVQAFKCSVCSSLHSTSKKAEACIKKCTKLEEKKQKEANIEFEREKFKQELDRKEMIICSEAESLDDIKHLFIKYSKEYLNVELNFSTFSFKFHELASNSHKAPRGKKTNWCGRGDDIPKGYPGFEGRIQGTFKNIDNKTEAHLCGSDFFDASSFRSQKSEAIQSFPEKPKKSSSGFSTNLPFHFYGIHTGGGSGGKNSFSYSATIFIDDFPKIKEKYEKFAKLKVQKMAVDTHTKQLSSLHVNKVEQHSEVQQTSKLLEQMEKEVESIRKHLLDTRRKITNELEPELTEQIKKHIEEVNFDSKTWNEVNRDFK